MSIQSFGRVVRPKAYVHFLSCASLISAYLSGIAAFLYRCPNTGFRVQGWVEHDESEEGGGTYESVTCHACGRLHVVNPKTGEAVGVTNSSTSGERGDRRAPVMRR
jgi:hypothetical protein